ncbi:MAG: T9SS type A sorting domain-containing protein [Bacteroidota bacterium]
MKTLRLFAVAILFIYFSSSFAQEGIEYLKSPLATIKSVEKHIFTDCSQNTETTNYIEDSYIMTGKSIYNSYDSDSKCYDYHNVDYVTCYKFDLTIPANAIITSIKITTTSGGEGYIVAAPTNLFNLSAEDKYNTVKGGESICGFPTSNPVDNDWIDITSYASQFRSNGFFTLGAYSNWNKTYNPTIFCQVLYKIPASITFKNKMGGQFSVNGVDKYNSFSNDYWLNTNISLSLNEPQYTTNPNYTWIWNDTEAPLNPSYWYKKKNGSVVSQRSEQSFSFSVTVDDHGATYEANLRKKCNLTFINNFAGIIIDGITYSSPKISSIVELNPITVTTPGFSTNYVNFSLDHWVNNGVNYSTSITTSEHGTYTAVYRAKPSNYGENPHLTSSVGQPITIAWTDNPDTNVNQYQIWRTVKHDGVVGPKELLATVGRGVQTYTDQEYQRTSTYVDLLHYDVRSYYSSTDPYIIGDYADEYWFAAYGQMLWRPNEDPLVQEMTGELPTQYAIANYPNPFNPTTTIKYQLPEAGMVTLKVYDILGKEVAELVNETKAAGYYEVSFDASKLTSGVYIYSIHAGKFVESKKMILLR